RALLGAELAGVGEGLARVRLAIPEWRGAMQRVLGEVPMEVGTLEPAGDLRGSWLPEAWAQEESGRVRRGVWRERLQWVGMGYLALLVVAFGWLAWQKSRLHQEERRLVQLRPRMEQMKRMQAQWRQVEPAVEPQRYLVEILRHVHAAIGSGDVRVTEFDMRLRDFGFSGEAANYSEATEYLSRLRKEPGMELFQVQSPVPKNLPNDRAQFTVSAKSEVAQPTHPTSNR
ncbi:MAG: hypothetical protein RLZZ142_1060, partial [Verrucomicrobiota bacterium]